MPDLAKKYDAALDPFFMDGVITDPQLLLGDGLPSNPAGIRKMAARVTPRAEQALKSE